MRDAVRARPILNELLEAYQEASYALERFQKRNDVDAAIIKEYEIMCAEIERDLMTELRVYSD